MIPCFGNAECSERETTRADGEPQEPILEQEPITPRPLRASLRPRLEVGDSAACGIGFPPKDYTSVARANRDETSRKRTTEDHNSSTPARSRHKRLKSLSGSTDFSTNQAAARPAALLGEQSAPPDDVTTKLQAFLVMDFANKSVDKAPLLLKFIRCLDDCSPLLHLCETLRMMRKAATFHFVPASCDIAATSAKLDELDRTASTCFVLRRYYLLRLLEHRDKREARLEYEEPVPSTTHFTRGTGKRATRVLEHLLKDMYPAMAGANETRDASRERFVQHKHLHYKLTAARKWMFVRTEFSVGMLFLIPAGRIYGVNHQEYIRKSILRLSLHIKFRDPLHITHIKTVQIYIDSPWGHP